MMEFHPSQIPAIKTFEIDNEKSATIAADQMVDLGFEGIKGGYLVLMPKEKRTAKRKGYTITKSVNPRLPKMLKNLALRLIERNVEAAKEQMGEISKEMVRAVEQRESVKRLLRQQNQS